MIGKKHLEPQKVLVVGYPGRLAQAFAWRWPKARFVGLPDFDITDQAATRETIEQLQVNLVVNCAALTDIDLCQREPDLAWAVNVRGVRNLAEACRHTGARLVHFSSDYALDPVNEYAWTKRASESLGHLTIRAKIYDGSHWAWKSLRAGSPIRMLTTEFLNPISTTGVVLITEKLIWLHQSGVISVGTKERLNFWQVGRIWAKVLGADPDLVEPIEYLASTRERLKEMFLDPVQLSALAIEIPTLMEDAYLHKRLYFSPQWSGYRPDLVED